jgi:hypothetical protein
MLTTENYRPCLGLFVIGHGFSCDCPVSFRRRGRGLMGAARASYIVCLIAHFALHLPFRPSFFILSFRRSDTFVRFVSFVACCVVAGPPHVLRSRLDSFFFLASLLETRLALDCSSSFGIC